MFRCQLFSPAPKYHNYTINSPQYSNIRNIVQVKYTPALYLGVIGHVGRLNAVMKATICRLP